MSGSLNKHLPFALEQVSTPFPESNVHCDVPVEGSKQIQRIVLSLLLMVTVKWGTYRFTCRGDLYRLVKFWQDSLLHFAFS